MLSFKVDIDKAIESMLFVLDKVKSCDIHKLFKILYFADKKHLADYGRPVSGDQYIAMKNGPVPSFIYDVVKIVRGDNWYLKLERDVNSEFEVVENIYIGGKRQPKIEYLSETDIECLEYSIEAFKDCDFDTMTEESHDSAWSKASRNADIKILDIAEAAGVDIQMLKYIAISMENQKAFA